MKTGGTGGSVCAFSSNLQDLRPKGLDVEEEKLGDLVDEEMAATAAAVEIAAARIEVRCRNVRSSLCPTPLCEITLEREFLD